MSQPASQPASQPTAQAAREQLARILASPSFQAHPRAASFLKHVVEKTVTGRSAEIKQATIGCEVFGRPATYEPRQDAIVRSVARVLREKLNDYYGTNGVSDPIRIELPKGTYVPSFRQVNEQAKTPAPRAAGLWRNLSAGALAACLLAVIWNSTPHKVAEKHEATDAPALYREGRRAIRAGDFVRARPLLEAAASAAPRDALIHASLSTDLQALGKGDAALDEARKAVAESGRLTPSEELEVEADFRMASGDYRAAVAALTELGAQHPDNPEYARSLAYAQLASGMPQECLRTVQRFRASLEGGENAQLSIAEAICDAERGDYLGALQPVRHAEDVARKAGQRETYAHARLLEAGLLMSTPRRDQAGVARTEARQICAALGDNSCVINALRQEANQNVLERRPQPALTAYRSALETARKESSTAEVIELLDGEGVAFTELDDYSEAMAAFTESMLLAHQSGQPTAGVRLDMVELALVQAQDARAIILAEQTERDARTAGDHVTEAAARILEARALLLRGDFRGCAGHLEAARRVIDKFHVTAGIPLTWRIARANLSLALGRLDDAAHQLAERDDPGDPSVDRSYNYRLVRLQLLIEQTHYDEAQRLASDTLALLRGGGDQSARIMVTALLSDAYGNRGQLAEAERAARSARSLLTDRTAPLPRKAALASAARWGAAEPILTAAFR